MCVERARNNAVLKKIERIFQKISVLTLNLSEFFRYNRLKLGFWFLMISNIQLIMQKGKVNHLFTQKYIELKFYSTLKDQFSNTFKFCDSDLAKFA